MTDCSVYFKSLVEQDNTAIVICDLNHTIIYMNPSAILNYKKYGGTALLGKSLLACHNENSAVMIEKVAPYYYLSSGYLETLKKHKQREHQKGNGFGYCVVNSESHESKLANTIMATGGSGKERNLIYQPVKDYLDMPLKGKYSNLNKDGIRMMTPTEWGRLQGFIGYGFLENGKETFSFPEGVARGQQYKQFGNSVSIPVIKCLADFMLECFDLMK